MTGTWHTSFDAGAGRFVFVSPENQPAVLRGISMTGLETGARVTQAGAGFWLFQSSQGNEQTNAPAILRNVVDVLAQDWHADVIRIPICGSAWAQDYQVRDWGQQPIATYKEWVDVAVSKARAEGKVVIIDLHLWAIARMSRGTTEDRGTFVSGGQTHRYEDFEDGCTGINNVQGADSCAPSDWYTSDPAVWQCAIANADGVTLHNAYKNKEHIRAMWADVANTYKADDGVWFELFNEPYHRAATQDFPAFGENLEEKDYHWDLWTEVMNDWIIAIRDTAQADNIIIVNGLDWGYSFGPEYGPVAYPDTYLPWRNRRNIAYGFHPYQHGSCCGAIGASSDESVTDPYQSGYCSYYPDGGTWGDPSQAPLPVNASCVHNGYAATQSKKMPPCHWVDEAYNPGTGTHGLCAGDREACNAKDRAACDATDWSRPEAGGWSKYVLPMAQYGPLIATEFGSFDCSSPFVTTLLRYAREQGISYTAWALWPQNSGGPGGLGACGYPSVMTPAADPGDFRQCLDRNACSDLIQPLPWAGQKIAEDMARY